MRIYPQSLSGKNYNYHYKLWEESNGEVDKTFLTKGFIGANAEVEKTIAIDGTRKIEELLASIKMPKS